MPYESTGWGYRFPYLLVNKGLNEREKSLAWELARECSDLHRRVQELEYKALSDLPEISRLRAENEFMLRLINEKMINE